MQVLRILLLSVAAAVLYGVLHDLVTAHVCVEYFTLAHPPIGTDSPWRLALGWGFLATWWVGLGLGVLLARTARGGTKVPMNAAALVRPLAVLMAVTYCCAMIAGSCAYFLSESGMLTLFEPWNRLPTERHAPFWFCVAAHLVSYAFGIVGGVGVCVWVFFKRRKA